MDQDIHKALPKSDGFTAASVNVGGDTGFMLSSDQFECFPRSLLNSVCTGRWSSLHSLDSEGRIFLDLDGHRKPFISFCLERPDDLRSLLYIHTNT